MASGYGMLGHILWNAQNSWGTSQVTSQMPIPLISESIVEHIDQLPETSMYGRFGEPPYHAGKSHISGDVSLDALPIPIGHIFKAAFGQVTTTSATGIQTHVFAPKTTDFDDRCALPPITIEVDRGVGSAALYSDMQVGKLTIKAANGQLLGVTASLIGAGFTRQVAATPTFPSNAPFQWSTASISWNGIVCNDFRDLTITLDNNLVEQYVLTNTTVPFRIKRAGFYKVDVAGTLIFAAHSYWDAFLNQSELAVFANYVGGTPDVLTLSVPKMRLKTFDPKIANAGIVEAAFTAEGMYLTTSLSAFGITMVNTQPWY